jgi:uncharacterized membrane protein
MATTSPAGAGYEFSSEENKVFARLVQNLSRSGLVVVIASVILLAYHLVAYFGVSLGKAGAEWITYLDYAVWGLISVLGVVIGVLLIKATSAFAALIRTEGDDLAHLMQGITRLADILRLVFIAAVGASSLLAISFTLLLMYS